MFEKLTHCSRHTSSFLPLSSISLILVFQYFRVHSTIQITQQRPMLPLSGHPEKAQCSSPTSMIHRRKSIEPSSTTTTPTLKELTVVTVDNLTWFDRSGRRGQYSGMLNALHGIPEGFGEMIFVTENQVYENNNPQQSVVVLSYKGQWVNGDMSGFGEMTFSSGEIYEGGFFDNHRHGSGIIKYPDGSIMDGIFQFGKILRKGRMLYPDGSVYWGYFAAHSPAASKKRNKDRAPDTSTWLQVVPHGRGKLTFADGTTVYDGEFSDGRMEGHGKLSLKDGSWYLGEFSDGQKSGIGLEVKGDGTISHEGVFCNGQKIECSSIRRQKRSRGQLLLYKTSHSTGSGHVMLVGPLPCRIVRNRRCPAM
jgi:hypothetical protein